MYGEEAALFLGVNPYDMSIPEVRKVIPPLNSEANSVKYWATIDLEEVWKDRNKLVRISRAIYEHWQRRNGGNGEIALAE